MLTSEMLNKFQQNLSQKLEEQKSVFMLDGMDLQALASDIAKEFSEYLTFRNENSSWEEEIYKWKYLDIGALNGQIEKLHEDLYKTNLAGSWGNGLKPPLRSFWEKQTMDRIYTEIAKEPSIEGKIEKGVETVKSMMQDIFGEINLDPELKKELEKNQYIPKEPNAQTVACVLFCCLPSMFITYNYTTLNNASERWRLPESSPLSGSGFVCYKAWCTFINLVMLPALSNTDIASNVKMCDEFPFGLPIDFQDFIYCYDIHLHKKSKLTLLLAWNPSKKLDETGDAYSWDIFQQELAKCNATRKSIAWRCNRKEGVNIGDDVYLMRLGVEVEPKGIVAFGHVTKPTYEDVDGRSVVDVDFEGVLDWQQNQIIDLNTLESYFPKQTWNPRGSGIEIALPEADLLILQDLFDNEMNKDVNDLLNLWLNSKQMILTGAPGTGKTYKAEQIAKKLIGDDEDAQKTQFQKIQFHPGYDYSDFIIGLKPVLLDENGQIIRQEKDKLIVVDENGTPQSGKFPGKEITVSFHWVDGIFKRFADEARKEAELHGDKAKPYVMLIDEINRADLSRVFGEVFSLLEDSYRFPNKDLQKDGLQLPSGEKFILSDNLYIIATMNDIDRSVESMDFALRRRFCWQEIKASDSEIIIDAEDDNRQPKVKDAEAKELLKKKMRTLNKYIGTWVDESGKEQNALELDIDGHKEKLNLGNEYQLGGAYFLCYQNDQDIDTGMASLWDNHLQVILSEYLRGQKLRDKKLSALHTIYLSTK